MWKFLGDLAWDFASVAISSDGGSQETLLAIQESTPYLQAEAKTAHGAHRHQTGGVWTFRLSELQDKRSKWWKLSPTLLGTSPVWIAAKNQQWRVSYDWKRSLGTAITAWPTISVILSERGHGDCGVTCQASTFPKRNGKAPKPSLIGWWWLEEFCFCNAGHLRGRFRLQGLKYWCGTWDIFWSIG